ncbi:ArpU family phage packaging/lysis transcriptional regulator [Bacillus rhizoplanae]|uniref:ArpU family phage packaging/lysis transcriptional regulator n=1 Tax=Bacillus rhizoplanae TaxID=2880966 RepID=UPI003D24D7E6
MSFFEDIDIRKVRKRVVKELKNYKALRVREQNRQERNAAGYAVLFPKMKDDQIHEIKFKQLERALQNSLDEDQREIIEMKYLDDKKVKDTYVYNELIIKRDDFYDKKRTAIRLIATALEII